MDDDAFAALRRQSVTAHGQNGERPLLTCAACGEAVYLCRKRLEGSDRNRYFAHYSAVRKNGEPKCPWYSGGEFTQKQLRALQFNGQKEGELHKYLKHFIGARLEADSECSDVKIDRFQAGEILIHERRRPDVACLWRNRKLVFELQVSYTFLSVVLDRDRFYQTEGAQVLWVFAEPAVDRAVVQDELCFNQHNIFILDESAREESLRRGLLVLNCYYDIPTISKDGGIENLHRNKLVTLADLVYQEGGFRPYFHDYKSERQKIEQQLQSQPKELQSPLLPRPNHLNRIPIDLPPATKADDRSAPVREAIAALHNLPETTELRAVIATVRQKDRRGDCYDSLERVRLDILRKIESIALGRPVVTQYKAVYEILAASLQTSATTQGPYAILLVEAWNTFRPAMKAQQERRMESVLATVRNDFGKRLRDREHVPERSFLRTLSWLYPEISPAISKIARAMDGYAWDPGKSSTDSLVPEWSATEPDRGKVADIGKAYVKGPGGSAWRDVYKVANSARHDRGDTLITIKSIGAQTGLDQASIRKFLSECGLIDDMM